MLAPSISIRSKALAEFISSHCEQTLSGSPSLGDSQFIAFANIRAVLVLPVPLGPQKRYACETLSESTALRSVFEI